MPRIAPRFAGSPPNMRLPIIWNSGLGAITHLQGPTDQTFKASATAPAAADASQAGVGTTIAASNAVAGTLTEGAAAGGSLTLQAGDAKRLTSGNADGGGITIQTGAGIGSGNSGYAKINSRALIIQNQPASNYGDVYFASAYARLPGGNYGVGSSGQYLLSSTTDGAGTPDLGLARASAGVARATDGVNTYGGHVMADSVRLATGDSTQRAKFNVTKVTKAHDSDLFNAAGLTDSVAVYTQPANSILIAAYMVLDTQFAAVGMTDLDVTLGDAGNNAGILNATMNLTSDAATTRYATKGAYFDATAGLLLREAATAWTAYATAVGANLDTTSAGSVSFYFVTLEW